MPVLGLRERPVLLAMRRPTRSAPLDTYAMCRPSGEGRGSITGPGTGSARAVPARSSATYTFPESANAANSAAVSTA